MYLAYDIGLHLTLAAALPYFFLRAAREPGFLSHWPERLGWLPATANPHRLAGIWIQAVSVGEVLLAGTLIRAIRGRTRDARISVSTTTAAGRGMALRALGGAADETLFFPLDLASAVRRTLDRVRPALFIAMETEIWPNLLRALKRREVPAVIVNGRVSPRAFRRYRRARFFFRGVLRHLDLALMQTTEDADRLVDLGMDRRRVRITGNLKFDAPEPEGDWEPLAWEVGLRPEETVFIAGSTAPGEEEIVLDAFERAAAGLPAPVLVLAPRHPQRFEAVARRLEERGVPFVRRSRPSGQPAPGRRVVLLDTLGELGRLYGRGQVVFVGGSLAPFGGHNILEPAAHGRPVIFGPHMDNFREVAERMTAGGGGFRVTGLDDLARTMGLLARDADLARRAGEAARAVVLANRGALDRTLVHLEPHLRRFGAATC
jgi:3-deoxy-D-manno-octulosonic-acid transferase